MPLEPIRIVQQIERCPRPERPAPVPLDPAQHIGSPDNVRALTENAIRLRAYQDGLEACVICYEAQAEAGEEN